MRNYVEIENYQKQDFLLKERCQDTLNRIDSTY